MVNEVLTGQRWFESGMTMREPPVRHRGSSQTRARHQGRQSDAQLSDRRVGRADRAPRVSDAHAAGHRGAAARHRGRHLPQRSAHQRRLLRPRRRQARRAGQARGEAAAHARPRDRRRGRGARPRRRRRRGRRRARRVPLDRLPPVPRVRARARALVPVAEVPRRPGQWRLRRVRDRAASEVSGRVRRRSRPSSRAPTPAPA